MVANPFFAPASAFFAPSVGDKVDSAIAQGKAAAADAQNKGQELLNKAELKVHDAKQVAKDVASPAPTGADLYARYVSVVCDVASKGDGQGMEGVKGRLNDTRRG
jgi:solute carrier family 25 phosphate transporter 3